MDFICKHRRTIALLAAFSFLYLIHVSTFPLRAATTPINDTPGMMEKTAQTATPVPKKTSFLTYLLIGIGAVVVLLSIYWYYRFSDPKYDITGTWDISYFWKNSSGTYSQTFTGDIKSGTIVTDDGMVGTYTVGWKDVNWTYGTPATVIVNYTGRFHDKTTMAGTMSRVDGADSGTWEAHKK